MIIQLLLKPHTTAILPAAYNSRLQGVIYDLLSSQEDYSTFLHDNGYGENPTGYKVFCFGPLQGKYRFDRKTRTIFFETDHTISWEIRGHDAIFCRILMDALLEREKILIADQRLELVSCEVMEPEIHRNRVSIRMQSPIVVSRTIEKDGRSFTKYYNPLDVEFDELIKGNYLRKYQAFYGFPPSGEIRLSARKIGLQDKTVTRYRGIYITGWGGEYQLEGAPDSIRFLYETGLGTRNSSGFGMFDII